MDVIIIGTGNVATVLGRLILKAGHKIVEVAGRTKSVTQSLAAEFDCRAITSLAGLSQAADIYIIAVSDKAIAEVAAAINTREKLVVHTAGSVSISLLRESSGSYGVLYPLQSIRKENEQLPVIPLLVDGCNEKVTSELLWFAKTISAVTGLANDEQRQALHIAAVITSNFTNHLYALAKVFCEKENVSFTYLQPLMEETVLRLRSYAPEEMQTGPAVRKDIATVEKHLRLLESYPQLQYLYKTVSDSIIMEG